MDNDKLIIEYSEYIQAKGLEPNSIKSYKSLVSIALEANAFNSLHNLNAFINHRRNTRAQRTFNLTLIAMRSFAQFNELYYEDELFPKKVMQQLDDIKSYSNPINVQDRRAYTSEQVESMMNASMSAWRWQVLFTALNLGLRSNQIRTLKLSDFDLEKRYVNVRAENSKNKKKISIPLVPTVFRTIQNWVETRRLEKDSIYYVETKIGKIISKRTFSYWKKQEKEIGFAILMHNCRYTFATNLWKAKKDLILCQKMLGHSSPVVTTTYLKLTDEEIHNKFVDLDFKVTP